MEIRIYRWHIQDGKGVETIKCDENTENHVAELRLERKISGGVPFGPGYRHFELLDRRPA